MRVLTILLIAATFSVSAQTNQNQMRLDWSKLTAKQRYHALVFTTPAYQKEALQLLITEANKLAQELNLPEPLPILATNLLAEHITPPRIAQGLKGIGTITTSNYVYVPYAGGNFSIVRTHLEEEYPQLKRQYFLPMEDMDTNTAYQLAVQFLNKALIDVKALNRDCNLTIRAFTPEGVGGSHFVPVYWVSWEKDGVPTASIEVLTPTKMLRQLNVGKHEYILRQLLQITNIDFLLSQTNSPPANTNLFSK